MINFRNTTFEGSLYELFEELKAWLPKPQLLIAGHKWINDQVDCSDPFLLVRVFAGHRNRGETYPIGMHLFCPVDNEPLAEFYEQLRVENRGVMNGTLKEAIQSGRIPLSWSVKTRNIGINAEHVKVGPAAAPFRKNGILLAHIIDASRGLIGDDLKSSKERYMLTMSPLNIFPWPGIRHVDQRIVANGGVVTDRNRIARDLSGEPHIQYLMAMYLFEYLSSEKSALVLDWYSKKILNANDSEQWKNAAKSLKVRIEPKNRQNTFVGDRNRDIALANNTTRQGQEISYFSKVSRGENRTIFDIAEQYQRERKTLLNLYQLDGLNISNPKPWIWFNISFFPDELKEIPIRKRRGDIIGSMSMNLSQFNGFYRFNGDTKCEALSVLFQLLDSVEDESDCVDVFDPCLTEHGRLKLNISGFDGARGLYCYSEKSIDVQRRVVA